MAPALRILLGIESLAAFPPWDQAMRRGFHRGRRGIATLPTLSGVLFTILALLLPTQLQLDPRIDSHTSPGVTLGSAYVAFRQKVQHIVFIVMENHAYDNYFGEYCQTLGPYCSMTAVGLPPGTCVPYNHHTPSLGCVKPYPYTGKNWTIRPQPHDWIASNISWDNGSMDGFYTAEGNGRTPMGYYNGSTAPLYHDMAEQYALGDNFFSSLLSYSLPNHWHIVAGQAPAESVYHVFGWNVTPAAQRGNDTLYRAEANQTTSVEDLLNNTTVSWKYYDTWLNNYTGAQKDNPNKIGRAYGYWNPQAAKFESYQPWFVNHFVNNTDFYGDARNNTLPQLSWVIPHEVENDHPPQNSTIAQSYVASVVNSVEASPAWNSTVIYLCWDDFGGFYDHVAPPQSNGRQQLGFRVPLMVIGPYVRENYVSHSFGYLESVLHLMEWRFNLGCITTADCTAPIPLDMFNFNAAPRPPMLFPTNFFNASYPMPLQSSITPTIHPSSGYYPPPMFASFPNGTGSPED